MVGARAFPEGVVVAADVEARAPLWGSDHLLLKGAYVGLAGHAELTPSFPRGGPTLTIAPVAFWDLRLRAWGVWYWGTFSTVLSVDGPGYAATRANNRAEVDAGNRVAATGTRLDADTRLKGRVGPIVAIVELQVRRHDVASASGELAWFWEPGELLTIPAHGFTVHRDAMLLYEAVRPMEEGDPLLRAGLYGTWSTCAASEDVSARLGPAVMWRPDARPSTPTLYGGAQIWLVSRFVEAGVPYTFVAAEWSR